MLANKAEEKGRKALFSPDFLTHVRELDSPFSRCSFSLLRTSNFRNPRIQSFRFLEFMSCGHGYLPSLASTELVCGTRRTILEIWVDGSRRADPTLHDLEPEWRVEHDRTARWELWWFGGSQ